MIYRILEASWVRLRCQYLEHDTGARSEPEGHWLRMRDDSMSKMGIDTLMSAADAAGYVMAAEDDLPDGFGRRPSSFDFKSLPATAIAIWRPVVPAASPDAASGQQWRNWLVGRFSAGAPA